MESPEPRRRSRFSAKLSRASGKKRAPGIRSGCSSTTSPRCSAITPQKSQTEDQNFSISAIEKS
jgi:hypothetical protein